MNKKVEAIHKILGLSNEDIALVLYTYLSLVLEELVINKKAITLFGDLEFDEDGTIKFKKGCMEFDNDLFSKKDILSILQVVENGPGKPIFS